VVLIKAPGLKIVVNLRHPLRLLSKISKDIGVSKE
jgi:hypothetical protein